MPNYATVEKVKEGFDAVKDKHERLQASIDENTACFEQLKKSLTRLSGHVVNQFMDGGNQPYNGKCFWPNEEYARTFGALVLAAAGKEKCIRDDHGVIEKALSEGSNIGGGYAVPSEMLPRIIDMLGRYGKFRSNCSIIPMGSDQLTIPSLVTDALVYCPGENTEIDEGDLVFGQVKLLAKTWAALLAVSNELNEDSLLAIGEIVARSMTRSMAKKEDEVGFVGDGTEAYFGMTGILGRFYKMIADSIVPAGIAIGSGQTWGALTLPDFMACVSLLPEDYDETAAWYMTKKFFFQVVFPLIKEGGFANIFNVLELFGIQSGKSPGGYPVRFVPCMPSATGIAQIPCILGDLQSGAYLGERKQLTIDSSEHVLFKKNQTCIRGIERVDINIFGCGDATNPGPIVGLRTAS